MVASSAQNPLPSENSAPETPKLPLLTLLLVGAAALSMLFTLYVYAANPAKQQAEASNNQRKVEMITMRDALERYANDHNGRYPTTDGQYWCADCSYEHYQAKGRNLWIPELVAAGYLPALPVDRPTNHGTACNPVPTNSYAGYVYYSPPPPNNTDYKLFAFCTPPDSALNSGIYENKDGYCAVRDSHNSTHFTPRPPGKPELRPFVDPVRPQYAYAIYTPGLACL